MKKFFLFLIGLFAIHVAQAMDDNPQHAIHVEDVREDVGNLSTQQGMINHHVEKIVTLADARSNLECVGSALAWMSFLNGPIFCVRIFGLNPVVSFIAWGAFAALVGCFAARRASRLTSRERINEETLNLLNRVRDQ